MAQLTFFNPETGEKLFEGEGQVFRTDQPETVEQLAKKIIDYNFRFLADFDSKEWD